MNPHVRQCAWCRRVGSPDGTFTEPQAGLIIGATHTICPECDARVRSAAGFPTKRLATGLLQATRVATQS